MSFIFSHGSSSKQGSGSPAICFAGAAVAGAALAAGAMMLVSRKRAGKKAEEKNIYESVRCVEPTISNIDFSNSWSCSRSVRSAKVCVFGQRSALPLA